MSYPRPLYKVIASALQARKSCATKPVNEFGLRIHTETLEQAEKLLPSGSGIDSGTKIDLDRSSEKRIVLTFGFHHMNEGGYYDGWTEHELIVTPSLTSDFDLRITGRDRNDIKDYLYQVYDHALRDIVDAEVSGEGIDREVKYFSVAMRKAFEEYQVKVESGEIV
jgi:hypothetical protein